MPHKKTSKNIYKNMKAEHRLRHRVSLLQDKVLLNPSHRVIFKMAEKLLKEEEKHGSGWFDWFNPNTHPYFNATLNYFYHNPVKVAKETAGVVAEKAEKVVEIIEHLPVIEEVVEILAPEAVVVLEGIKKVADVLKPFKNKEEEKEEKLTTTEKIDKAVENIVDDVDEELDDHRLPEYIDESIRFPMVYNYDESIRPMNLSKWLAESSLAGKNFSRDEFNSTYKNRLPYEFLNNAMYGGKLGKINYSSLGYSKY